MSTPVLQEDQLGVVIRPPLTKSDGTALDLTGATITFVFLSPSGDRTERAGAAYGDPTLGYAQYTTVAGDLDAAGVWQYQVLAEYSASVLYISAVGKLKVKANL